MIKKAGLLVFSIFFIYFFVGLFNFLDAGTPNNTNDFIFHFYKANKDLNNSELLKYYSPDFINQYPDLFHSIGNYFSLNKFIFWLFCISLVLLVMPFLLFKLSGAYGVIVYFGVSLPFMVIYNATFPSFVVLLLVCVYLLKRKDWLFLFILTLLASQIHKEGLIVFAIIWFAEVVSKYFKEENYNLGLLVGVKATNLTLLISLFLTHLNIYYLFLARKSINVFYFILIFVSVLSAVFYDIRAIILGQLIICIILGNYFKTQKPNKKFWLIWGFCLIFNLISFLYETQKFIYN